MFFFLAKGTEKEDDFTRSSSVAGEFGPNLEKKSEALGFQHDLDFKI